MTLPKPFYENENGKLYCGDCLEILPQLEPVDLVLTDPPYVGLKGGVELNLHFRGVAQKYCSSKTIGDKWTANLDWVPLAWEKCVDGLLSFCSFHFVSELGLLLPQNRLALATWYQRNTPPPVCNVPHFHNEFIWFFKKSARPKWRNLDTNYDITKLTAGCISSGERVMDENKRALHPTQKPCSLIVKLLSIGCESILDPFTGSGTTAVACERLKRKWIGIEISEEYCAMAVKRIESERRQLKLF